MIPAVFRARRALENLNVAGVGFALAAMTAAMFSVSFHDGKMAWFTGIPTLLFGALWARLLRWPKTLPNSSLRVGWLWSIPLAALNAALAAALMLGFEQGRFRLSEFLMGMVAGATFGMVFWVPALLLTLVCFGVPVAWSQRLAARGLAGQERGEMVVGAASFTIALAAMALAVSAGRGNESVTAFQGQLFTCGLGILGVLSAGAASLSAMVRAARRRAFVTEVEAGKVARFRVDATDEGKVLVRVISQGQGYRVADFEEELAAFDREGNITRSVRGETEG